ncbi:hypothetical protein KAFR_0F02660 [Kazachstania africana CBS 2517]|uniref:Uncharacterized protein n=1 Tax=Kazachstania africana (strain ATCC 22294 / BCRC 22015 / CBS 2517 / CECT 1963 / NBRC 1671 / NRRL Y-8276) TaxID=1071382 RepID=H2AWW3_KAZAF|nr:hypothetical protein KAFR_0F02660 [Kazachstania africana CBS 2517]CCF58863.1 hypothetical protein KAFR_0F02660 [Kazachstania africana CBS 2517]
MKSTLFLFQVFQILSILQHVFASNEDITTITMNTSSYQNQLARQEAAKADMAFFMVFLEDFQINYDSYTSYMIDNHVTLPQAVANYYFRLELDSTVEANLLSDIAYTFPFTQFQSFITRFPWYSSLLADAGATTMCLPEYYVTKDMGSNSTISAIAESSSSITITSSTSISNDHSDSVSSHNGSNRLEIILPMFILAFFGFFV